MNRKYIKENQLIFHAEHGVYGLGIIINVRKADREDEKELKYDIKYLLSGEIYEDIYEHSGMTSSYLESISTEDANNKLLSFEYDLDIKIGQLNKNRMEVLNAKNILKNKG